MNSKGNHIQDISVGYSDQEYIQGLQNGDKDVIHSFFYYLCRHELKYIQRVILDGELEYDELVNELFLYLSSDNWRRLNTYDGKNGCSLKSWICRVSRRFFTQYKKWLDSISFPDDSAKDSPLIDDTIRVEMAMDLETIFKEIGNNRYLHILTRLLEGGFDAEEIAEELSTTVSNVYNLKHRALKRFKAIYKQI